MSFSVAEVVVLHFSLMNRSSPIVVHVFSIKTVEQQGSRQFAVSYVVDASESPQVFHWLTTVKMINVTEIKLVVVVAVAYRGISA